MTQPFMRESQRERLRSKELWTMMERVVWLCPLRERERERESAWCFDSVKRITTRRIVCRDIILRHNIMLL